MTKTRWTVAGLVVLWVLGSVGLLACGRSEAAAGRASEDVLQRYASGKRDFAGMNLENVVLRDTDLSWSSFVQTNLKGADLSNTNLNGCAFLAADLRGANLSGTDLRWTTLNEANLTGANLAGANLLEASLINANLSEADLTGAIVDAGAFARADSLKGATMPDGSVHE